jgi:hypothetical protein
VVLFNSTKKESARRYFVEVQNAERINVGIEIVLTLVHMHTYVCICCNDRQREIRTNSVAAKKSGRGGKNPAKANLLTDLVFPSIVFLLPIQKFCKKKKDFLPPAEVQAFPCT